MNLEYEIKEILRWGGTTQEKVKRICQGTTFTEDKILKALKKGGKDVSEVYGNIIKEHKNV